MFLFKKDFYQWKEKKKIQKKMWFIQAKIMETISAHQEKENKNEYLYIDERTHSVLSDYIDLMGEFVFEKKMISSWKAGTFAEFYVRVIPKHFTEFKQSPLPLIRIGEKSLEFPPLEVLKQREEEKKQKEKEKKHGIYAPMKSIKETCEEHAKMISEGKDDWKL